MPKVFTSETQKIGKIAENIAKRFLVKRGFLIKDENYTKKCGEIDIVAEKNNNLYFIEVKSTSFNYQKDVSHETNSDKYRPEENMHPQKIKRLSKTIQIYLMDKNIEENKEFLVNLIIVYLDTQNKKAKVKMLENVIN